MKILQFPLARITIFFILGILVFRLFHPSPVMVFIGFSFNILALIGLHIIGKKSQRTKPVFGILVLLCSLISGLTTAVLHKESQYTNHYINKIGNYEKTHQLEIVVKEKIKVSSKYSRFSAIVTKTDNHQTFGKIILNLKKSNQEQIIIPGTKLIVESNVLKNTHALNPHQFDYGTYLENKEIYGQIYTDGSDIKILGKESNLMTFFSDFRLGLIKNLSSYALKPNELHVLTALLLGQQQDLSPEIVKDYQYAGAVHILSVSGLHVGYLLIFSTFILNFFTQSKKHSLFRVLLILIILWSFGILAGLSPSVVRSVTMFSFVAIGNHLKRGTNTFHTLLVSLLLILLFQPGFLFDVGFQLSYLALFFILWLQPIFASFWKPENKIFRYFWDIMTVSFAAQIGTLPLCLYYFHQFPGLFFITNLVVLPLIGFIMIIGLLAVIFACFSSVPEIIIHLTGLLIKMLNATIHYIATFEDFVIQNISFTSAMLWTSYLSIIFLIFWMQKPVFKKLRLVFLFVIALQSQFIFEKYRAETSKEFVVFRSKQNLFATREKGKITLYSDNLKEAEKNPIVQSYITGNFCSISKIQQLKNLFYFNRKRILVIDSTGIYPKNVHPDIVILTNSPKLNPERLIKNLKPQQIIASGSNYKSYVARLGATCRKEKIPFHNTYEKGFLRFL